MEHDVVDRKALRQRAERLVELNGADTNHLLVTKIGTSTTGTSSGAETRRRSQLDVRGPHCLHFRPFGQKAAANARPSAPVTLALVVTGAAGEVAHPAAAAAIGAAIPHASRIVLPDGDHDSMYLDPTIAQSIHDFIAAASS